MTEAQKLIAEALRRALAEQAWTLEWASDDMTVDGCVDPIAMAMEVDEALGGLTLQVAGPDGIAHGQARFVSGWKDVERPHS
ncbi:hypothetical protein OPTIMUS_157 [Mycobacterium phage Optimus]|uniref:Uncharacterized protein n=3 Tax=Omegavirus TaxID=1623292 RepID=A0A3S9UB17_9CAUD|nr:hypothetical protein FDG54_gp157 [Mycobacterium phage Optimus]YP_009636337.1 hypothetical protein FGG20_gp166 [Mycobacterium phage Baka]ATN89877.1 hypothetical protein SEA_KLEIN_164 [Mycobacterium phage Klein]AXQ52390.1 hypothetical protein SEA_ERICMILLARD_159 [Mycobacterium phage EricMillard]AYB69644.1 hypothetical protein SEA_KALAH2_157 [Mycobacterium phage Kalah2]AZS07500.1 hypothetical protein PBI_DUKE13_163 [Mycobacterium phage Duke13]QBI98783.1 hypothetical protein SEA_BOBBY_153 [Myc